jgi:hypothetical protein
MPETFALTTADPRFDPRKPVIVNGFTFAPPVFCEALRTQIETHIALGRGREKTIKRLIEERDELLALLLALGGTAPQPDGAAETSHG